MSEMNFNGKSTTIFANNRQSLYTVSIHFLYN